MSRLACIKCGKPATKRFSPDMDINGIGSCDACLDDVRMAYASLLMGDDSQGENIGEQIIDSWQKKLTTLEGDSKS